LDATSYSYPEDIDRSLNWPLGTAARLARRNKLPHYRLPDDSIRFRKDEVEALVRRVPPPAATLNPNGEGVVR
jgi:hypothetical protein